MQVCTDRQIAVVPDPAFMLAPAEPAIADRYLGSLGLPTDRPIIGLSLRKWFHPRGGFIPSRLRIALGLSTDSGRIALRELLTRLAAAIAPIAAEMHASILLLPTYSAPYENDVEVCRTFASLLPDCDIRLACISDPALYKAVTGRLRVLISSRMHPLILAAGMGTPIVGLAYNGKFEGMFDMLQMPRQMLWLEQIAADLPLRLASLVHAALADVGLRERASRLAAIATERTASLLLGDCSETRAA
jgi:polysaccharide pyruvyl transferase WcaK-like protein